MDASPAPSYRGYRFPVEIISQCDWLYFRFCLSFPDIQEMMLERGAVVSREAIRLWCLKFGAEYARCLRHRRVRCGDTWHLDEVFCKINGQLVYLRRAVDQEGEVLDILVQSRRNANAHREIIPAVEPRRGGRLNSRAENSPQSTRQRERRMRRFKSLKLAQRFLSTLGQVSNHFRCGRHLMRACHYRNKMVKQFETRRAICGLDQPTIVDHRLISP